MNRLVLTVVAMLGLAGLVSGCTNQAAQTPKPQSMTIKEILRSKGLSDFEAFQEAKKYIGAKCLDKFEQFEKALTPGHKTAYAYAQERTGRSYVCGASYRLRLPLDGVISIALTACENGRVKRGINVPCEVLAVGNKIVWERVTLQSIRRNQAKER